MNYLVCFRMAVTNMRKHKMQSLLNIFISMAVVLFICLYLGNLMGTKEQLADLPEIMPVYGYITNPTGDQKVGLEIEADVCEKFENTDLIKDIKCTLRLAGGEGRLGIEQWRKLDMPVLAANNIEAVTGMMSTGTERYNEILADGGKRCIVNKSIAEDRGWRQGDNVLLTFSYYKLDNQGEMKALPLRTDEFEIVDVMDSITVEEDRVETGIIIPLKAAQVMFDEEGIPCTFDSLSFTVARPLELNEFKDVMQEWNLFSVSPQASTISEKGTALYLKDENFIAMANQLKEQIQILNSFVPVIIIILVLLEIVISFLFVQRRKPEIIIQRILGMSGKEVRHLFLGEQVLAVVFAGCLCVGLGRALGYSLRIIFMGDALVLAGCVVGSYMSLIRGEAVSIMKRVSQND